MGENGRDCEGSLSIITGYLNHYEKMYRGEFGFGQV